MADVNLRQAMDMHDIDAAGESLYNGLNYGTQINHLTIFSKT